MARHVSLPSTIALFELTILRRAPLTTWGHPGGTAPIGCNHDPNASAWARSPSRRPLTGDDITGCPLTLRWLTIEPARSSMRMTSAVWLRPHGARRIRRTSAVSWLRRIRSRRQSTRIGMSSALHGIRTRIMATIDSSVSHPGRRSAEVDTPRSTPRSDDGGRPR